MHQPIYRQIISQAWSLSWRNKSLWIFGFFAAFLINGGVYDLAVKMFSRTTWLSVSWSEVTGDITYTLELFRQLFMQNLDWSSIGYIVFIIFVFLVFILFLCLSIIAQGSLINSVDLIVRKKKIDKAVLEMGMKKFWPVAGINIILKVLIFLLVVLITFSLYFLIGQSVWLNALLHLLSYLIFIPLAVIFYFIAILACCYIVLRNKKLLESISSAWGLFKRHWLICLELGFLLFVISFLIGMIMLLVVMVLSIPILLLFLAAIALQSEIAYLVMLVLSVVIVLAVVILGGSFMVAFQYTSWVLLFERLTKQGGLSRLARWVSQLGEFHRGQGRKKSAKRKIRKKK